MLIGGVVFLMALNTVKKIVDKKKASQTRGLEVEQFQRFSPIFGKLREWEKMSGLLQ